MRTRDEIEAELHRLGWRITSGPTRTPGGFKATIASIHSGETKLSTGSSEIDVLESLLLSVQDTGRES